MSYLSTIALVRRYHSKHPPPPGSWGILPAAGAPLFSSSHCLPISCLLERLKTQRDCVRCCS